VEQDVDGDGVVESLPRKSASTEEWRAFAAAHGMTEDEASGLSRDELVAHYYEEG
jgi:predicted PhzF superfamily epimerase YddE/YHI9